ncbi:MAG: helix-turn-helix domain-containing protein [Polyangiaceae bacterium]
MDKLLDGDDAPMNTGPWHLNRPVGDLMGRARVAMGFTQQKLGDALGSSKRTAHRWESGRASPSVSQTRDLAVLVFPRDPALAEQLAAAASTTLAELGLGQIAAPSLQPHPPTRLVVQAVVCVAADELAVAPDTVRGALYAAFKCARELRLSTEDVEKALEPVVPKKPAPARVAR